MTALCDWGGLVEVCIAVGREFPAGEWDTSAWDEAEWEQTDTELGDWLDVTCDTIDGITLSAGSSRDDGVVTRWEAASVILSLLGENYDPRAGPWAGLLGPALPVRIRWRPLVATALADSAMPGAAGEWTVVFVGSVSDEGYRWDPATGIATLQCTDRTVNLATFDEEPSEPPVGAGDTAAGRIIRLADLGRWPSDERDITAGGVALRASNLDGTLWAQMLNVADSDVGLLWITRAGKLAYRPQGRISQGVPIQARLVACPDDELPSPPPPVAPVNLLPLSNQADIEDGNTTGWNNTGGQPNVVVSATTEQAEHGSWSYKLVHSAASPPLLHWGAGATTYAPVKPGKTYTLMYSVRPVESGRAPTIGYSLYTSAPTLIGSLVQVGSPVPVVAGQWNRIRVTVTLPNDPTIAYLRMFSGTNATAPATWYYDRAGVFEGDVPSDQWQGFNPPPGGARNLLPSDQLASVEDGTTAGFTPNTGGTIAAVQANATHGTWSLALTAATATNPYVNVTLTGQAGVPVTPSATFTLMADAFVTTTGDTGLLGYQAFDAAGAGIGAFVWGAAIPLTAGATTRMRRMITTPAGAAFLWFTVGYTVAAIGRTANIDRLGVFAGDVPSLAWSLPSASPIVPAPRNLLPTDNLASVEEGGTTGFVPVGATTLAATQTRANHGTWSLNVTGATITSPRADLGAAGVSAIPVTGSTVYTMLGATYTSTAGDKVSYGYQAYDDVGTAIGAVSFGPQFDLTSGAWTRSARTFTTGATVRFLRPVVAFASPSTGRTCSVDRLGLFAGTVPSHAWQLPSAYAPPAAPPVQYVNLLHGDPQVLRNWVSIARARPDVAEGAPQPPEPVVVTRIDDPSIARFRPHRFQRTDLDHADDAWSGTLADVVLANAAWPSTAPSEALLDSRVTTDIAVPALLLGLEPEHVFNVDDPIDRTLSWRMAVIGWKTELFVSRVSGSVYLADVTGWERTAGWDDPLPAGWDYTSWALGA